MSTCILCWSDRFLWIFCWLFLAILMLGHYWIIFMIFWFHLWYMMLWLKLICFILLLVVSSKYTKSMTCGLMASYLALKWIWTFFTGWPRNGQFISCYFFCSAFDLSFMLRLLQPASYALVCFCLWSPSIQLIWPDWSGMMKKVCYDQTYFLLHGCLLACYLISFLLKSIGEHYDLYEVILYVMTTLQLGQFWIWYWLLCSPWGK